MDFTVLMRLNLARRSRIPAVLVKNLERGTDRVITEDEDLGGELGEAVSQSFRSGRSRLVEVDGERLFLNVQLPPPHMVIIGAVHISQALAQMASLVSMSGSLIHGQLLPHPNASQASNWLRIGQPMRLRSGRLTHRLRLLP